VLEGLTIKITGKLVGTDNGKGGTLLFNTNIGNFLILEAKKLNVQLHLSSP
jgi:hypothetical protein